MADDSKIAVVATGAVDDAAPLEEKKTFYPHEAFSYKLLKKRKKIDDKPLEVEADEALKGIKIILVYFSGSWCGPCRTFTPVLTEFYNIATQECKGDLEVVFVSWDQDASSFDAYYGKMPWLAIPYEEHMARTKLRTKFKVDGIPSLAVVNGETGEVISFNARMDVRAYPPLSADIVKATVQKWITTPAISSVEEDEAAKRRTKYIRFVLFVGAALYLQYTGNTLMAIFMLVMLIPKMLK